VTYRLGRGGERERSCVEGKEEGRWEWEEGRHEGVGRNRYLRPPSTLTQSDFSGSKRSSILSSSKLSLAMRVVLRQNHPPRILERGRGRHGARMASQQTQGEVFAWRGLAHNTWQLAPVQGSRGGGHGNDESGGRRNERRGQEGRAEGIGVHG
jgi:hypothetical protein